MLHDNDDGSGYLGCRNISAAEFQPKPKPTTGPAIWSLVIADMTARDDLGAKRYGTRLQANNGRDALQDAYEEALDLCVYLRQVIEERRVNNGH